MPCFDTVPALIRVIGVFLVVLVAIRKKMSLGNAFLIGSILMGLAFNLGPREISTGLINSVIYPKTLCLAAIVSLILILSSSMEAVGQMKRLLAHFRGLISLPILNLAIFPSLIGLLPMPGGAVFSAPMVKELSANVKMTPAKMGFINYWYRHIWEYWWPLYPGVLLTTALANLNLWLFVATMFPVSVMAVLAGTVSVYGVNKHAPAHQSPSEGTLSFMPFFRELLPILFVIVAGLGMGLFFSAVFPHWSISKEAGLIIALLIAIVWIWVRYKRPKADVIKTITDPALLNMIYMVIAILAFKGMLESSQAVTYISQELKALHVPLMGLAIILPFLVGLVTGITIAFAGSTFPILILLVQFYGETRFMMPYIMTAFVSGFIGVLFSPLHLCLILTNEYFSCRLGLSYRLLLLPCGILFFSCLVYFYLLRFLF